MTQRKKGSGGARPGAGRPKLSPAERGVTRSIRMRQENWDKVDALAAAAGLHSAAEWIEKRVEKARAK